MHLNPYNKDSSSEQQQIRYVSVLHGGQEREALIAQPTLTFVPLYLPYDSRYFVSCECPDSLLDRMHLLLRLNRSMR